MRYRLHRQEGGSLALHDATFGETMHPGRGPWAEAVGLYVEGSGLAARLVERPPGSVQARGGGDVVLFDVGLGGAANALAAVACHRGLQQAGRRPRPLHLVSFESEPEGLRFACREAEALIYPRGHEDTLEALLMHRKAEPAEGVTWELRVGDFTHLVHDEPRRADIVFFDPFSPRVNPELWSLETLTGVYRCRRPGSPMVLVTYSSAFNARAAMLLAGFYVGEGPRPGGRRGNTTLAASDLALLEHPLSPGWLARWRRERDPWPPGTPPARHRQTRTALLEHPQWATADLEPREDDHRPNRKRPRGGKPHPHRSRSTARGGPNTKPRKSLEGSGGNEGGVPHADRPPRRRPRRMARPGR